MLSKGGSLRKFSTRDSSFTSLNANQRRGTMRVSPDIAPPVQSIVNNSPETVKIPVCENVPDYEAELDKRRSQIDSSSTTSKLVHFPANEVSKELPEKLAWFSIYGAKSVSDVNVLAKKTIETLSSNINECILEFKLTEYDLPFTHLPKFRPLTASLFKHEYMIENFEFLSALHSVSMYSVLSMDQTILSGFMEVYPPLIDSTDIDKWIHSNKPKRRYFSLTQETGGESFRLIYKKDQDPKSKYEKILFMDNCTSLKQTSAIKSNAFQLHINEKIIVFVAPNATDYQKWVKNISDASGLLFEQGNDRKSPIKKPNGLQESWQKCGIPALVEYSKENENSNQKQRKETRYKLLDLYPDIIDYSDTLPQEKLKSTIVSNVVGERVLLEFGGIKFHFQHLDPFLTSFALYDIKTGEKMTEDFICNHRDTAMSQMMRDFIVSDPYNDVVKCCSVKLDKKTTTECAFTINYPRDNLYIVAKFFKMYTANINKLWDIYTKRDAKNDVKLGKQLKAGSDKVKKYLMPIGYSFKKMYNGNKIDSDVKFSPVMKYDHKLAASDLCKIIREVLTEKGYKCQTMNIDIDINLTVLPAIHMKEYSPSRTKQLSVEIFRI
ncbi:Dedicator of cytokinesis protein 9 [Thelohanellus kitauei]|uniref:Dedicator of cytokinesis protein 9 n=1 Tax=Thelohanellus kitauei TaxID=669202 RepID=A0A0C2IWQ6_THEKT|nr:Dedicator of cytokinesis protein 9 [Thelohanellus kitauei]